MISRDRIKSGLLGMSLTYSLEVIHQLYFPMNMFSWLVGISLSIFGVISRDRIKSGLLGMSLTYSLEVTH